MSKKTSAGVITPEIAALCVDYRRGGMSYRQISDTVTRVIRERMWAAHVNDIPLAAKENRAPIEDGHDFSLSHEGARKAVIRTLVAVAARTEESGKTLRALELERLDQLQAALWPKAMGGGKDPAGNQRQADTAAARAILKIMEQRRILTGISADDLGAAGEEGAKVTFGVWQPDAIEKRKAQMAAERGQKPGQPPVVPAPDDASIEQPRITEDEAAPADELAALLGGGS